MSRPTDTWAAADAYERYVGRWSRPVAIEFIEWLAVPPALMWLDVGCGTGALSETISRHASPADLNGIDASLPYLTQARLRLTSTNAGLLVGPRATDAAPVAAVRCGRVGVGHQLRAHA